MRSKTSDQDIVWLPRALASTFLSYQLNNLTEHYKIDNPDAHGVVSQHSKHALMFSKKSDFFLEGEYVIAQSKNRAHEQALGLATIFMTTSFCKKIGSMDLNDIAFFLS